MKPFETKEQVQEFLTTVIRHVHHNSRFFLTGGPIVILESKMCGKCKRPHLEGMECPAAFETAYNTDDVKICSSCGGMAIRRGTCHTCVNCGTSLGCS